jgi:hypothetical protein
MKQLDKSVGLQANEDIKKRTFLANQLLFGSQKGSGTEDSFIKMLITIFKYWLTIFERNKYLANCRRFK